MHHARKKRAFCILRKLRWSFMADIFDLFRRISQKKEESGAGAPEFAVVGLGNPGSEYALSRHNIGFMALDNIAEQLGVKVNTSKFNALVGFATIASHRVLLMKPMTYMNNSGTAVAAACSFYKIPAENVIVFVDDVCQDAGRMRIRKSGSDGGHNGLKSIICRLSSDTFCRVRIGVGEKPNPEYNLADWVIGHMPDGDMEKAGKIFACCRDALPMLIEKKFDDAMGKYNGIKF